MSKRGVAKAVAVLTAAYQREMSDATIALYVENLEDIPDDLLMAASRELVIRSVYFPTIASIRDHCARMLLGDALPPETSTAWKEVAHTISTAGRHHRPQWRHPLIGLALEEAGGYWDACLTTNVESTRLRFEKAYERMRLDTIKNVAVTRFDYRGTPQALEAQNATQQQNRITAKRPAQTGVQEAGEATSRTRQGDQIASRNEANL